MVDVRGESNSFSMWGMSHLERNHDLLALGNAVTRLTRTNTREAFTEQTERVSPCFKLLRKETELLIEGFMDAVITYYTPNFTNHNTGPSAIRVVAVIRQVREKITWLEKSTMNNLEIIALVQPEIQKRGLTQTVLIKCDSEGAPVVGCEQNIFWKQ